MRANLASTGGDVILATLTAPGESRLPWDGQRVAASAANDWNSTAARRWSQLHRRAQQACAREGFRVRVVAYAWQQQRRGVDHLHLVLPYASEAEKLAAKRYAAHLRRLSARWGFGYLDFRDRKGKAGRAMVMAGLQAAKYVTAYLGDSRQLDALLERPKWTRPPRIFYVGRHLQQSTHCTMRRLRRVRYLHQLRYGDGRSVFRRAGSLPEWFRDGDEYVRVNELYRGPPADAPSMLS